MTPLRVEIRDHRSAQALNTILDSQLIFFKPAQQQLILIGKQFQPRDLQIQIAMLLLQVGQFSAERIFGFTHSIDLLSAVSLLLNRTNLAINELLDSLAARQIDIGKLYAAAIALLLGIGTYYTRVNIAGAITE